MAAQYNLGLMHIQGRGIAQDDILAHVWFNIAASNGSSDALNNRDIVEKALTAEQVLKAQKIAKEWTQSGS